MSRTARLLAAVLGLSGVGCENQGSAALLFGPCERDKDCTIGLSCEAGVCVGAVPAPSDGGGARASNSDVADGNASTQ